MLEYHFGSAYRDSVDQCTSHTTVFVFGTACRMGHAVDVRGKALVLVYNISLCRSV